MPNVDVEASAGAYSRGMTPARAKEPTHPADTHDVIRVRGARENNLRDVSVELPKRGSPPSPASPARARARWSSAPSRPRVAADDQRDLQRVRAGLHADPGPPRRRRARGPDHGHHRRPGADGREPRSTVGTATDANAMLRILFSRVGKPYVGSPNAFSFNVASVSGRAGQVGEGRREARRRSAPSPSPAACARAARAWARSPTST
jgi:hypothetical protein